MGKRAAFQCIGPSYHLADRKAAVQSAVNCFVQKLEGDSLMLASAPGRVQIADLGADVRGSHSVEGRWFVVAGSVLYEVSADGAATARGAIAGSGFVGMAHNGTQLAIVTGNDLYVLALSTNALTQITVEGWLGSDDVHELDGYFIFVDPGTEQFYLSAIDDGTSLNALDFSSADSAPDSVVTHRVLHRQLWLLGERTSEIWIDSGDEAFPFVRYNSYTVEVGIVGKRAAINAADTLFFIGQTSRGTGLVYMIVGNQPQRVSTLAVEEALAGSTDLSAATMWAYQVQGHEFIGINAPGLASTWVYDAATQTWHERAEWDADWQQDRAKLHTFVHGAQYCADAFGKLYRLDDTVNTLAGLPLVRERTWPHLIAQSLEPTTYRCLELACTTGHGGSMTLEVSNDGGSVWGAPLLRSLGEVGQRMKRVSWYRLGTAVNRVFRLRCSDAVPFAIHLAALDLG